MSKLRQLVKIVYKNEYTFMRKKQFSDPKIYDAKGDLSKRWYVYFTFRNPETDKLERQPFIDTGINQHKNLTDRREAANVLVKTVREILRTGQYNPYSDNDNSVDEIPRLTVPEAVKFVLEIKKNEYKGGYIDFKSRVTKFQTWLLDNHFKNRFITVVSKTVVQNYLNHVLEKTSASNRNNTRSALINFFACLEDNEIISANPVSKIKKLETTPQRHKSFTNTEVSDLFQYLATNDPMLGLYIKFVSYNFLRPIEVSRLLVRNIDVVDRKLYVQVKTGQFKIKIIPDILFKELPDLTLLDQEKPLFGKKTYGEVWDSIPETRRGDYSDRFREVIKIPFKFGIDYGIYSFRHTFIATLFTALLKEHSPDEAESMTMHITGHATRTALRKYLREIDASLPADYSKYLKQVV